MFSVQETESPVFVSMPLVSHVPSMSIFLMEHLSFSKSRQSISRKANCDWSKLKSGLEKMETTMEVI